MKTLILITTALSYFCLTPSFAQRYKNPDLTIMEWMDEDCIVTDRSKLGEALEKLPADKVCTALVDSIFYLFFTDKFGNKHQLITPAKEPEIISFAISNGQNNELMVMGDFYWGSLNLNKRSYTALDSAYEHKEFYFRDWKYYMKTFLQR